MEQISVARLEHAARAVGEPVGQLGNGGPGHLDGHEISTSAPLVVVGGGCGGVELVAGLGVPGVRQAGGPGRGERRPARVSSRGGAVDHASRRDDLGEAGPRGGKFERARAAPARRVVDVVRFGDRDGLGVSFRLPVGR